MNTNIVSLNQNVFVGVLSKILGISLVFCGLVSPVVAQEGAITIEEVIVTARKRAESLQDVPVAVTAITEDLKEPSVRRIDDIQAYSPNVYLRRTTRVPGGLGISIRGVSYTENDKTFDPSVGIVVDGVYMGTSSGSLLNNFDIERVEVLRGPQGTLHGKNTTGGVINVIRTPVSMNEVTGNFGASAGSHGRKDIRTVMNMPLVEDRLGLKLFANVVTSDGEFTNVNTGENVGGDDYRNYGLTTRWEPTEDLDIQLHLEMLEDKSDTGTFAHFNTSSDTVCAIFAAACADTLFGDDTKDVSTSGGPNRNDTETENIALTMNWDLGGATLTSITASRDITENFFLDFDALPINFLEIDYFNSWEQLSQEFRLAGDLSDNINYVAGLFYWEADYSQRFETLHLFSIFGLEDPGVSRFGAQDQETTSTAAFFSVDYDFSDEWTLTVGGRYLEEEKDFQGAESGPNDSGVAPEGTDFDDVSFDYTVLPQGKWTAFTPRVGLRYQPNDDITFFTSYSEGYKSGGFFGRQSSFSSEDPFYDSEELSAIELGMKSTLLDGRMTFNPTLFYSDYEDKQEAITIPTQNIAGSVIRNAAIQDIYGIELELQYLISEAWDINVNYGYTQAEYSDFFADINGDGNQTDNDSLNARDVPENTFGLNSSYTVDMGEGELKTYVAFRWRDEVDTLIENLEIGKLDSIANLDATISYLSSDGLRISLYGRNITDEREVRVQNIATLVDWGVWNEGANYGVEVSVDF